MHRAGKYAREVSQMMAIGLRTAKDNCSVENNCEVQLFSGNSSRAKVLSTRDRRSLKRFVKANQRKSVQQLTTMFNEGPKKISARIMQRELKEMGLRSCVPTRKPGCDKLFGLVRRILCVIHDPLLHELSVPYSPF